MWLLRVDVLLCARVCARVHGGCVLGCGCTGMEVDVHARGVCVGVCTGRLGYEGQYVCGSTVPLGYGIRVCRYVAVAVWFGGVHICVLTRGNGEACVEIYVLVCGVGVGIGGRRVLCGQVCWGTTSVYVGAPMHVLVEMCVLPVQVWVLGYVLCS